MANQDLNLAGVMPPVPTPFDQAGEISPSYLQENISRLNAHELAGYVILGSNGEYVYLDEAEKLAIIKAARQSIPSHKLLLAGTGTESTRATIRLTQAAAEVGADAAIVITPAYYKPSMTGEAMLVHFTAVADASPIPVILYNMPAYAGIDMSVETILKLAAHPNIIGLKESSGNIVKIAEIVNLAQTRKLNFTVLAGSASFLLASLAVGASGGVVALANVAPENCLNIYREFQAGNMVAAKQAQQKALAFNAAVTSKYGVAGLKHVMDKIGLYGGPVRPPLLPITSAAQEDITRIMSEVAE